MGPSRCVRGVLCRPLSRTRARQASAISVRDNNQLFHLFYFKLSRMRLFRSLEDKQTQEVSLQSILQTPLHLPSISSFLLSTPDVEAVLVGALLPADPLPLLCQDYPRQILQRRQLALLGQVLFLTGSYRQAARQRQTNVSQGENSAEPDCEGW